MEKLNIKVYPHQPARASDINDIVDYINALNDAIGQGGGGGSLDLESVKRDINYLFTAVRGKQDTLVSGSNIKTINGLSILGSGNITINGSEEEIEALQQAIARLETSISTKQNTLVSGTNIKTINGQSLLGSGNIEIQGGGGATITIDSELSATSTNPLENRAIYILVTTMQATILDLQTRVEKLENGGVTFFKLDSSTLDSDDILL